MRRQGPASATGTGQVAAFYVAVNQGVAVTGAAGTGAAGTITAADTVTDSGTASGVASSAAAGTVTASGKGTATPTGVSATGALGDVYSGEAFMIDPVQAIGTAGVIGYTASGSATVTGVESRPLANAFDFTSRLLVRAIRVTAYMEIT